MAPIAGTLVEVTVEAAFTTRLIGRGVNFITLIDVRDADGAESPTAVTGFRVRADSRTARPMSFHVGRPIYGPFSQGCFLTSTVTLPGGKARFLLSDEPPQGLQAPFESAGAVPIADNGGTLSIDDGNGSITVDGTLSITEPVSVDDNAGSLTVDDGGLTLSIDDGAGSLTVDAPLGAPVHVNLVQNNAMINAAAPLSVQPGTGISFPVTDNAGTLTVDDGGLTLSIDDGAGSITVDGTVTVQDGGGTISVDDNGTTLSIDDGTGSITVDTGVAGFVAVGNALGSNAAAAPLFVNPGTTGVFPVNDNAGTLTVDDGGLALSIDDGGNVISVDDAAGSLTVDGTVTVQDGGGALTVDGSTYQEATAVYNGQHIHGIADDGVYVALDGGGAAIEITTAGKGYVAKIGVNHPAITSGAVKVQYKRTAGDTYRDLYFNSGQNEQNLGAAARADAYSWALPGRGFYSFPIKLTAPDTTAVEVNIEIHPVSAN